MASALDICNGALDRVAAQTIVSLDEASAGARACQRLYPQARDALLRLHDWRFATERRALAPLEEAPPPGWARHYGLPADCLRVRGVEDSAGRPARRFELRGEALLADRPLAALIYTRQIETAGYFDPLFAETLIALLAVRLGAALRVDPDLVRGAERAYRLALAAARAADANEAADLDQPDPDWIEARR